MRSGLDGDIAGRDAAGRTLIVLAVEEPLLERLLTFDAGAEDLEDGGDAEPDDCRVLSFDKAPVRRTYRGRHGRLKTVSRPPKTKDRPEPRRDPGQVNCAFRERKRLRRDP